MSEQPSRDSIAEFLERLWRGAAAGIGWFMALVATLWAAGAVYVDGPLGMTTGNGWLAMLWVLVALACLLYARPAWMGRAAWLACFLIVLVPWLAISPSNDRDWKPRWSKQPRVELDGTRLTFHNFRNFSYHADGTVTRRWERRTVDLANLRGVDYLQSNFGGEYIAHPLLSFDFGPDGQIALSVETRRETHESFSEIGGLYKMFELIYMWGDERDFLRLRTNVEGEPMRLYRTNLNAERSLYVLLDSVRTSNWLSRHPRFYSLLTENCTTSLQAQTLEFRNTPLDYRMLANGKLDELLYEHGGLITDGLPFAELRERSSINEAALAAPDGAEFSRRIRQHRPGFKRMLR